MNPFDITPNPRILVVLTHTAMKPIDALCELIDNSIDSFRRDSSNSIGVNEIYIKLPAHKDLASGGDAPFIRVSDNGPGMTFDEAQKALTAGYSSKSQFNNLGLFGVGLNIATGKFARKTRLITATKDADSALIVDLDLDTLTKQKNFQIQPHEVDKIKYFPKGSGGTIIELSKQWPDGNPNCDFVKKLIQYPRKKLQQMLERRYATLLRNTQPKFNMFLGNGKQFEPFEHCVWSEARSVLHGQDLIPAMRHFNSVLKARSRCMECGSVVENGKCIADDEHSGIMNVEERVRGWIGVQRFDDTSLFGIDLIRKGRTIRPMEKDAFFTYRDDAGNPIADYPIDGPYGRIVGEVHLDHVPVNFTKEDFDRSTPEWQEAMAFVRGTSSLQANQAGANVNKSPLMKIFTGYRRVRPPVTRCLYMGQRQEDGKIVRNRPLEKAYYEKFLNKEEGYRDDTKWFEHVDLPETDDSYNDCPNPDCDGQNPSSAEICTTCDFLLKSKKCLNTKCKKEIQESADICPHCSKPQVPEGPWTCSICGHKKNPPDFPECRSCNSLMGAVNPFNEETLLEKSSEDDSLSLREIEIDLPDKSKCNKFSLIVRTASLQKGDVHFPAIVFPDVSKREVRMFIDKEHPMFKSFQMRPHYAVAEIAADFVMTNHIISGAKQREHNLVILTHKFLDKYWGEVFTDDSEQVRQDIRLLLDEVQEKMVDYLKDFSKDIYGAMSDSEIKHTLASMREASITIEDWNSEIENGNFMRYIPPIVVMSAFENHTSHFFNKNVWAELWHIPGVPENVLPALQKQLKMIYRNCLEDCINFLSYQRPPSSVVIRRARLSLEFLERGIAK